jgi:hypothetical protein
MLPEGGESIGKQAGCQPEKDPIPMHIGSVASFASSSPENLSMILRTHSRDF